MHKGQVPKHHEGLWSKAIQIRIGGFVKKKSSKLQTLLDFNDMLGDKLQSYFDF